MLQEKCTKYSEDYISIKFLSVKSKTEYYFAMSSPTFLAFDQDVLAKARIQLTLEPIAAIAIGRFFSRAKGLSNVTARKKVLVLGQE